MRVNRRFLYVGAFLTSVGGILVAADLGVVDSAALTDALRLWPLAAVAIGLSLVARRTRFSLPGGILAAALPGVVLGGALAVAPRFVGDCGARGEAPASVTQGGTFDGPATIAVKGGCGSMNVRTAPGNAWQLTSANTARRAPRVESSAQSLSIGTIGDDGLAFLGEGRDTLDLTLPASAIDSLAVDATASRTRVDLSGASIAALDLTANASEVVVDASAASITTLSGDVNVGMLSIHLPAGSDVTGRLSVGGGDLQLCTPPGLALSVTTRSGPKEVTVNGLHQTESRWQSPDYASAVHHADLTISAEFGAIEINPIGGCK